MFGGNEQKVVVIDLGSAFSKCGFAGEGAPRHIVPTPPVLFQEGLRPDAPLEHLIRNIFSKRLQSNPRERKVLVIESAGSTRKFKDAVGKILFERLQVPSVLFVPSALCAIFASGVTSGLVIDVGYSESSVVPIVDGTVLTHAIKILPLGSCTFHRILQRLMSKGSVARVLDDSSDPFSPGDLDDVLSRACFVLGREEAGGEIRDLEMLLPSGRRVWLSGKLRGRLTDCFFGRLDLDESAKELVEEEFSLAKIVAESLIMCSIDARNTIVANVVVAGGLAHVSGFVGRLVEEVKSVASEPRYEQLKVLVESRMKVPGCLFPPCTLAWIGGSVLGELPTVIADNSTRKDQWILTKTVRDWTDPHSAPILSSSPHRGPTGRRTSSAFIRRSSFLRSAASTQQ